MKTTYASKKYIRSIGGITRCYPLGKGQGLFKTQDQQGAKAKAETDGWKFIRLAGVGHDYNFDADIFKITKDV